MIRIIILLLLLSTSCFADQFEDIPAKLEMGAGQTVRRNLADNAFEAVSFPTPLPTSTPQTFPTPVATATAQPTATPQTIPATPTPLTFPLPLAQGGTELSNAITNVSTSGSLNNLTLTTSILRLIGGSTQTLTGIASNAKSQRVLIVNLNSSGTVNISHESGSSSANNRINLPSSATYSMPYNTSVELFYDTTSSRWRLATESLRAQSPLLRSGDLLYLPQASAGQNGYVSSTDYSTYLDNWKQTGSDIYNTNTNNVWITLYSCASLTTYATCAAKVGYGCNLGASGACSAWDGNEASCSSSPQGSCSWNSGDNTCTASSCDSFDASQSGCGAQSGCFWQPNTCPDHQYDEYSCNNTSGCSWTNTGGDCGSYSGDYGSCTSVMGCSWNECSSYSSDEYTCINTNASCSWSVSPCSDYSGDQMSCEGTGTCSYETADCSTFNGDQMMCESYGCNYSDPDCTGSYYTGNCTGSGYGGSCSGVWCSGTYDSYSCSGSNADCYGTATQCSTYMSSGTCTGQAGCNWTETPAGRFQGDTVITSDGYLEFEKTSSGAPTGVDCDNDSERGRLAIDTTNNRLYICNGASRGWDYAALTN